MEHEMETGGYIEALWEIAPTPEAPKEFRKDTYTKLFVLGFALCNPLRSL